ALGALGLGREGVVKELFEVPAQLGGEVAVRALFDREAGRRGDGDGLGAPAVLPQHRLELPGRPGSTGRMLSVFMVKHLPGCRAALQAFASTTASAPRRSRSRRPAWPPV